MKNTRGFTLIEVVVALVIFSLTMLFGLSFFVYGRKNMQGAYETTTMLQVAKDKIETEKTRAYDSIISIAPVVVPKGSVIPYDYTITQTVSVETTLSGPLGCSNVNSKIIDVTVSWTSLARGSNESITLKTMVAH